MADARKPPFVFLPEPEAADRVIDKADALLNKHRTAPPADDDMPVLTEIVADEDTETTAVSPDPALAEVASENVLPDFIDQLIGLDAMIARHIDTWLVNELPAVLDRELDGFKLRLRDEIHAHMRATLIADISREISDLLDTNDPRDR